MGLDPIFDQKTGHRDRDRKIVGHYLIELISKSCIFSIVGNLLTYSIRSASS